MRVPSSAVPDEGPRAAVPDEGSPSSVVPDEGSPSSAVPDEGPELCRCLINVASVLLCQLIGCCVSSQLAFYLFWLYYALC